MGLNAKEIPFCFFRMIQVSIEASFKFIRSHPLIYGVLIILCILYSFLSYIYHFLVYLSPFLVCAALFVRIFWSSEEGQLSIVKRYEKKEEQKEIEKQLYKLPSYGKRDMLLERRYSPGNATSRRRNFTDKKWDVQDAVVEAKGKESSTVESCGSEKKDAKSSENEENSSNFAEKLQNTDTQILPLQSEASIREPVKASDSDQQNNKPDSCSDELEFEKEKNYSDYAGKSQDTEAQVWPSEPEPSIRDQVKTSDSDQQNNKSDSCSGKPASEKEDTEEAKEKKKEEEADEGEESQDEEESQKETNKAVEWSKDDQKNLMDLGISEIERNRRLESLIARRRARQQVKLQMEQGQSLTDVRQQMKLQMAPLNIARTDPLKSPRNYGGIEGLEIPGSAPSALRRQMRNPFDLPYDASEEKPNLSGDSFHQEFIPKYMTFCRHESFSYGASLQFDEESYPFFINGRRISDRLRRLPDKGNHDLIIEKLFSKTTGTGIDISTGVKAPKPLLVKFETTTEQQENTKSKTESIFGLKWKKAMENAQLLKSLSSDHKTESSFMEKNINQKISDGNDDKFGVSSEKPQEESKTHHHHHKPINKKFLNFPISTGTAIFEDPLDSISSPTIKDPEDMPFPERCIFHEPTCSIASDLQVEFSEIGSPTTLTVDGESLVFDGDIDKETDLTPRSDDLGPIKLRSCDEGVAEMSNNNSPKSSPIHLLQKAEEDVIDVSSLSSTSDLHGDSPTHARINYDYNIFSDMRKDEVETQATHPSDFLIGRSVDHPPHETYPQKPEERQNLSETEIQVVDHHVSSPSSTSDSHGDTPTHERINYDYNVFSDMKKDEVETQATQPSNSSNFFICRSVDYPPHESQSEKPEERQNPSENSETEAQILDHYHVTDSSSTTDIENSNSNEEDLRPSIVPQHQESIDAVSMKTFSSLSPRSLSPDNTLMNHVSSSALNLEDMTQEPPTSELSSNTMPPIMITTVSSDFQEPTCSSTMANNYHTTDPLIISKNLDHADRHVEEKISGKDNDARQEKFRNMKTLEEINNKLEAIENDEVTSDPSKVTENVGISTTMEDGQMTVKLSQLADVDPPKPTEEAIPPKPVMLNDSSEEANEAQNESKKSDPKISSEVEINELSNNDTSAKSDKQNDSSGEVSKVQSEPSDSYEKVSDVRSESRKNGAEISSNEGVKAKLDNDISSEPNHNFEKVSDIPKVNEGTSSSSVEDTEEKNNEVIEQESNKKEAMVLSSSVGTSEDGITINMKKPEEAVNFQK